MVVDINKIKIGNRIRKEIGNITELANDIEKHGLINPITITSNFELLAGLRRFMAIKQLGYKKIDVKIMSVEDSLEQLEIEISENENRKNFTFSERMEYAKKIERLEKIKAKERQRLGLKCNKGETIVTEKGKVRYIVAKKIGIGSGKTYSRSKFIYNNYNKDIINKIDNGNISISKAYNLIKNKSNKNNRKQISRTIEKHLINKSNGHCEICNWGGIGLEGILIPHHIHKYAKTENNSVDNLVMICPNCHQIIHTLENCKDEKMIHIIQNSVDKNIINNINYYVDILKKENKK